MHVHIDYDTGLDCVKIMLLRQDNLIVTEGLVSTTLRASWKLSKAKSLTTLLFPFTKQHYTYDQS